jgi:hypothetical protein
MFAMVFKSFLGVFTSVLDACFKCFICLFFCMLQLLHLDVSKVDHVLHIECPWKADGAWMTFGAAWATSGVRGPIAGALAREPHVLGARFLPVWAVSGRWHPDRTSER